MITREESVSKREDAMAGSGRSDDIFEILVTTYRSGGKPVPVEDDLNWRPATDVYETDESFVVQMDLSGMDPSAIEVLTDGETLVVKGSRSDIAPPGKKHYFTMEISVGPFARRIPIPVPVRPESALARYRNGFLFVSLDKGDDGPAGGRRRIDVGSG